MRKTNDYLIDSPTLMDFFASELANRIAPQSFEVEASGEWDEPQDIVDWAHSNFIDPVTGKIIHLQKYQQRLLRRIFRLIWDHKVTTVVWSQIKKSGKTTTAGLIGAYWAANVEPPNEVISVANDQEQAQGRIYAAMTSTMKRLGWNVPEMKPQMTNRQTGTVIKAIGTNYEGEAGGNYGLTVWSELWAYRSEARRRLWDELTPVPTRLYSVRWIETYAGFLNESDILYDLYCQAFKEGKESQPLGTKVEGLEDLPVWLLPEAKLLVFWDHERRMPWQTDAYYGEQRASLRPNAFKRLHQNEWVSNEDAFITPDMWDALEEVEELDIINGDIRPIILAADGAVNNDSAALVAVTWNHERKAPDIVYAQEWRPQVNEAEKVIIDLDATLGTTIEQMIQNLNVVCVCYDPYQLHSIMTNLQKKYDRTGVKELFLEFPQTNARIEADQALYQWISTKRVRTVKHKRLREHALNAVARETERGFRLDKTQTTQKIDLVVAASMGCYTSSVKIRTKKKYVSV